MSLIEKLKQRKLVQWALAYGAAAWVLLQILALAADSYHWPDLVMHLAFAAVVLGLIVTLVLAWYHGERGAQKVTGTELLILALLFAIGGFLIWQFAVPHVPSVAATRPTAKTHSASSTDESVPANTIAVLPFENLSSDPDNAYFATGMQDEILTKLSKIGALRVISRTSTMRFASKPTNLREIAHLLGASAILEGSVQKAGDMVHINVQLIRAATDQHLWAESYNRKLTDVFAMEGEVAQAVAQALDAALTGHEKDAIEKIPTNNTQAYEYYLRGLALEARYTNVRAEIEKRVDAYSKAVQLDPTFGLAWAMLASAKTEIYFNYQRSPAYLAEVKQALDQARRYAPDTAETWQAVGLFDYYGLQHYDAAYAAYSKALQSRPNDGLIVYVMGNVRRRQGHWLQALPLQVKATELDPLASNTWFNLGLSYRALRRYTEAQAAYDRGLAALPGDPSLLRDKVKTFIAAGDLAGAADFLQSKQGKKLPADLMARSVAEIDMLKHDYPAAIKVLRDRLTQGSVRSTFERVRILTALSRAERVNGDNAAAAHTAAELKKSITALREHGNNNPYLDLYAGWASALMGDKAAAYREADEAAKGLANDALGLPPALQTQAFSRMLGGDHAQAIAFLAKSLTLPQTAGTTPAMLAIDPDWDPLRKYPAFQALQRQCDEGGPPLDTGGGQQ